MNTLILHPTELSQWYAIVNEAEMVSRVVLDENTESYLVFLLMRFLKTTRLVESIIALDFLESMHAKPSRQIALLRDVGDKSLLFCGLFPGIAKKRHLSLQYFSDMGQSAYLTVGELEDAAMAGLYFQLSKQFLGLQTVLRAMRGGLNEIRGLHQ